MTDKKVNNLTTSSTVVKETLKNYIKKIAIEHNADHFAMVTSPSQEKFEPVGSVVISSVQNLPEDFEDFFYKYLSELKIDADIKIVGSTKVGFIATENCLRIVPGAKNILIQIGEAPTLSLEDLVKTAFAAIKAATVFNAQKEVFPDSFSEPSLLHFLQKLLEKGGFLIGSSEQMAKRNDPTHDYDNTESNEEVKPKKSGSGFFGSAASSEKDKK